MGVLVELDPDMVNCLKTSLLECLLAAMSARKDIVRSQHRHHGILDVMEGLIPRVLVCLCSSHDSEWEGSSVVDVSNGGEERASDALLWGGRCAIRRRRMAINDGLTGRDRLTFRHGEKGNKQHCQDYNRMRPLAGNQEGRKEGGKEAIV